MSPLAWRCCRHEAVGPRRQDDAGGQRAALGRVLLGAGQAIAAEQHQQVQSHGGGGPETAVAPGMPERESARRRFTKVSTLIARCRITRFVVYTTSRERASVCRAFCCYMPQPRRKLYRESGLSAAVHARGMQSHVMREHEARGIFRAVLVVRIVLQINLLLGNVWFLKVLLIIWFCVFVWFTCLTMFRHWD